MDLVTEQLSAFEFEFDGTSTSTIMSLSCVQLVWTAVITPGITLGVMRLQSQTALRPKRLRMAWEPNCSVANKNQTAASELEGSLLLLCTKGSSKMDDLRPGYSPGASGDLRDLGVSGIQAFNWMHYSGHLLKKLLPTF